MDKKTYERVMRMQEGIDRLHDKTADFYNKHENGPMEGSIAYNESQSFRDSEFVMTVHSQGLTSLECAADHLLRP